MNTIFDKEFFDTLLVRAKENPRQRVAYDLRTTTEDLSQRILNAVVPDTEVSIHCHPNSTENVLCLCGKVDEIFYDAEGKEKERIHLCPADGIFGCVVPAGVWHTVKVFEPSVIYESKDGKYGADGSETLPTKSSSIYG